MKAFVFLTGLSLFLAAPGPAQDKKPDSTPAPGAFTLSVKNGRVSLSARQANLAEILQSLSKQAGFSLSIYEPPTQALTAEMADVSVEDCLKKLFSSYSFVYRKREGEGYVLSAVAVFRTRPLSALVLPARPSGPVISYGNRPGEIGRINLPEVERQGPRSFAVDEAGNMYICDTVNGRLKVFSPAGKLTVDIPVPGGPGDVAVAESGAIYILDDAGSRVLVFDPKGTAAGEVPVPRDLLSRAETLNCRGGLSLLTRDQEEHLLAVWDAGELNPGPPHRAPVKGTIGSSGSFYLARKVSPDLGEIEIRNASGELTGKIGLPVARLASIVVLGDDKKGNLYLQVEQSLENGPGVDLGVLKLDREGNLVAMLEKIPNNYVSWTARLLQVDRKGDVYQMLPGPDCVALNRYRWEVLAVGENENIIAAGTPLPR